MLESEIETDVLIIGGGPVGMALGLELSRRGVRCLIAEQEQRIGRQPRAKTTNVRTMEHMRRWGLAETVRAARPMPAGFPTDVVFATRLDGPRLLRIHNAFYGDSHHDPLMSEAAQWIPQYKIEAVLRDAVMAEPNASLRLGLRADSLSQDEGGVSARLVETGTGAEISVRATYAVGADGARSFVRGVLGINMQGSHGFASNFNLIARVPGVADILRTDPAVMYWLVNPQAASFSGPMDTDDTWFIGLVAKPGQDSMSVAEAEDFVRATFGRDVPVEIMVIDPWLAHSLVADRYRGGRIFLAGDACHLHPPFGGYGMNLGIGDAVDLGWKLAAVVRGWGGEALLDSYQIERRPVHMRVVEEAVENNKLLAYNMVRPGLEDEGPAGDAVRGALAAEIARTKPREFHTLGVVKGYRYAGSPVIASEAGPPPPEEVTSYTPSAYPGCVAPHAWLDETISLYDRFGPGFTLLVMDADAAPDAAALAAAAGPVPVRILHLPNPELRALYGASLALIRPDQHVAWRGERLDRPAALLLELVSGQLHPAEYGLDRPADLPVA